MLSQAAVKKEALKLDTIINHDNILNEKTYNAVNSKKSKAHSVPVVKTDVNIHVPNHAAVIRKTSKLDTTVNHEDASSRNTIYSRKTKTLSVSSDVSGVISNAAQKSKKLVSLLIFALGREDLLTCIDSFNLTIMKINV